MTQGKIERWHQTMKNRVLLENYYQPGALEHAVDAFVAYYTRWATIANLFVQTLSNMRRNQSRELSQRAGADEEVEERKMPKHVPES